jgi:hypothetical protein
MHRRAAVVDDAHIGGIGTLLTVIVWLLFATIVTPPVVASAATAHARIDLIFIKSCS